MVRLILLAGLVLVAGACSLDSFRKQPRGSADGADAAPPVDTAGMTRTPRGLRYKDLVVGTGDSAVAGRAAVVHYTGRLDDGRTFDSSHHRGVPFTFTLGAAEVIEGWDIGVAGMRVGGTRVLVIPGHLGYGEAGGGGGLIPPNATLTFEVELLELR